ncbi:MAG TPA: DsbA family oxidoreductase [Streptosporangiaceae bacterium]|jgi:predicted DsbA family dithiol-disulfide isomerase|nr:DsbA family oxidoreductase [Streptosporangiaceae bacterium]
MRVEIWSDVVCPWCYLGKRRFEQGLGEFAHRDDVEVTYRSFELDPDAPKGVTTPTIELLGSKYGMSAERVDAMQRQMEERAEADGLTFRMAGLRSGNTRDAHRLLQLAKARGRQEDLAERLHRAYFTEQSSIFDHAALTRLAEQAGLDADEAAKVLASEEYEAEVDTDEAMAHSLGVTGVPFFVIDRRYGVSGAQPAEVITEVLDRAWADAHAPA